MKSLVTGATGFIGSAVVRELLKNNVEVKVLVKPGCEKRNISGLDVEVVEGDILDISSVEKALDGCNRVYNLAAYYSLWTDEANLMYKINVDGARNVFESALKKNIEKVVHTSSFIAIGPKQDKSIVNEDTQEHILAETSYYARSKYVSQQIALEYAEKGLNCVVVNPGITIGTRDLRPTPSGQIIVNFLNRRYPVYVDGIWNFSDVEDIARGHRLAMEKGRSGKKYLLVNSFNSSMKQVLDMLEDITGIKAPTIKIPRLAMLTIGHVSDFSSLHFTHQDPIYPLAGIYVTLQSPIYDNSKTREELGYSVTPLKETLNKAVDWFKHYGNTKVRFKDI